MGGGRQSSSSRSSQMESGSTSSALGSTPQAQAALPGFQQTFQTALQEGPYTGPVAAPFNYEGGGPPVHGDVSGFIAQPNATEREGLEYASQGISNLTGGAGQDFLGDATQNLGQYWADVTAAGPEGILQSDPYQVLLGQIQSNAQNTLNQQNANIAQQFAGHGGWGGTEQARAAAFATGETERALADTTAGLGWQAFQFGHDLMGRAPGGIQDTVGAAAAPGLAQFQIGGEQRGLDQLALDEELAASNFGFQQGQEQFQNEMFQAGLGQNNEETAIANAMALNEALRTGDMGLYQDYFDTLTSGVFGQNTNAQTTSSGSSFGSGSASDPGQTASNIGSVVSAAALAAMAFWSDERLKENIVPLALRKGVQWYEFEFKPWARRLLGLPEGKQIGVMAQDLLGGPLDDVVSSAPNGYFLVDYARVI